MHCLDGLNLLKTPCIRFQSAISETFIENPITDKGSTRVILASAMRTTSGMLNDKLTAIVADLVAVKLSDGFHLFTNAGIFMESM